LEVEWKRSDQGIFVDVASLQFQLVSLRTASFFLPTFARRPEALGNWCLISASAARLSEGMWDIVADEMMEHAGRPRAD